MIVPPLHQTAKGLTYIPIPPDPNNVQQIDLVLHIPIAAEYFFNYLEESQIVQGPIIFALYADLRYYDRACTD